MLYTYQKGNSVSQGDTLRIKSFPGQIPLSTDLGLKTQPNLQTELKSGHGVIKIW